MVLLILLVMILPYLPGLLEFSTLVSLQVPFSFFLLAELSTSVVAVVGDISL